MRSMLAPSMLEVICNNIKTDHAAGRFFELAPVYLPKSLPVTEYVNEIKHLCLGMYGASESFYTIKGVLDSLAATYGINFKYEKASVSYLHPGRSARVLVNGKEIGVFGQLRYEIVADLPIAEGKKNDAKIFLAELDYAALAEEFADQIRYTPLSDKEAKNRDISLLVAKSVQVGDMMEAVKEISKLVKETGVVDIYESEKLGADKKSVTLSVKFATEDHSVTDEEADTAVAKLVKKLGERFEAQTRE